MSWTTFQPHGSSSTTEDFFQVVLENAQELLAEASRLLKLLLLTTMCSGGCRAYSPGAYTRKDEDGLLLEFPCNPIRALPCNPTRTPTL
jgi:hypothetical protein